jgi:hypothetical protein
MIAGTIHEQQDELPGVLLGQCLQKNLESFGIGRRHDQIDAGSILRVRPRLGCFGGTLITTPEQAIVTRVVHDQIRGAACGRDLDDPAAGTLRPQEKRIPVSRRGVPPPESATARAPPRAVNAVNMAHNQSATRRASASISARISDLASDPTFMTHPSFFGGRLDFGAEHITFHRLGETFVIVRSCDELCLPLNFRTGVAHGNAHAALCRGLSPP